MDNYTISIDLPNKDTQLINEIVQSLFYNVNSEIIHRKIIKMSADKFYEFVCDVAKEKYIKSKRIRFIETILSNEYKQFLENNLDDIVHRLCYKVRHHHIIEVKDNSIVILFNDPLEMV